MDTTKEKPPFFPRVYEVEANKVYIWCGCGKTSTPPLDDGVHACSHAVKYQAIVSETVLFCGCGQTQSPPFCDGSHGELVMQWLKKQKDE